MNLYAAVLLTVCGAGGEWPDGSLLFLEHGSKPVAAYTGSTITHVGLIRNIAGKPYVYEASPGAVRRTPLSKYQEELQRENRNRRQPIVVWALEPLNPYTRAQQVALRDYANEQLGRRYSVKGYLRKRQSEGIHCAQFVATALEETGRFRVERQYAISPAALYTSVRPLYRKPTKVTLSVPQEVPQETWCKRQWKNWAAVRDWCAWASYETWRFWQ